MPGRAHIRAMLLKGKKTHLLSSATRGFLPEKRYTKDLSTWGMSYLYPACLQPHLSIQHEHRFDFFHHAAQLGHAYAYAHVQAHSHVKGCYTHVTPHGLGKTPLKAVAWSEHKSTCPQLLGWSLLAPSTEWKTTPHCVSAQCAPVCVDMARWFNKWLEKKH